MSTTKIGSIILAVGTVLASVLLAATNHISWVEALPVIASGLSILGIHIDLPTSPSA